MTVVFLIRHGRTAINAAGLLRGHLDKPPDPVGEREADALGALFARVPLHHVFTSPLGRARQTAVAERLIDRDDGCWIGQPKSAVEARYGSLESAPEVEPWRSFQQRIHAAFEHIDATATASPIAIVAHDDVLPADQPGSTRAASRSTTSTARIYPA